MTNFPSIEEVHSILDQIAEDLPKDFFKDLNEGIVLLPQYKIHPQSRGNRLIYIMGEYSVSIAGRNIKIYYGSFKRTYGGNSKDFIYQRLRDTLLHEFTHHLESLAGERGLEIKDKEKIESYRRGVNNDR